MEIDANFIIKNPVQECFKPERVQVRFYSVDGQSACAISGSLTSSVHTAGNIHMKSADPSSTITIEWFSADKLRKSEAIAEFVDIIPTNLSLYCSPPDTGHLRQVLMCCHSSLPEFGLGLISDTR